MAWAGLRVGLCRRCPAGCRLATVCGRTGRGGPRLWTGRLASGVGARFHARPASWGAALVRGLVRCSARSPVPVTCGGSMLSVPQGGVIALEVCLA